MARISHANPVSSGSNNPATKFLEWKSNDKCFEYYDKEVGKKVKVELPLKFLLLEHYHTVKGFNDASNSGIWSNEVYYIGTQPMSVRAFKGGEIASGLYKDIKAKVNSAGGDYHRSIYIMFEDGSIANIALKGSGVSVWSDFHSDNKNQFDNHWIEVLSAKDQKKGSVKYSTPVFTVGNVLDSKESATADAVAREFQSYMNSYLTKDVGNIDVVEAVEVEGVELDF